MAPSRESQRWEKKVAAKPGAAARVSRIESELRLAIALTALREEAGVSQRDLAEAIGVSQPRIAAIERSRNVTIDVLAKYVAAVGGQLEVRALKGRKSIPLFSAGPRSHRGTAPGTRGRSRPGQAGP